MSQIVSQVALFLKDQEWSEWDEMGAFPSSLIISVFGTFLSLWMFQMVSSSPDFKKFPVITTDVDPL